MAEMAGNTAAEAAVLDPAMAEMAGPTAEAAGAEMPMIVPPGKAGPTAETEGLEARMEATGKK